jgi:hypothetical protein
MPIELTSVDVVILIIAFCILHSVGLYSFSKKERAHERMSTIGQVAVAITCYDAVHIHGIVFVNSAKLKEYEKGEITFYKFPKNSDDFNYSLALEAQRKRNEANELRKEAQ